MNTGSAWDEYSKRKHELEWKKFDFLSTTKLNDQWDQNR